MAFKVNGTDIDSLFEPIGVSAKIPNVGYKVAGTDISNFYADAALGTAYGTTNYNKTGTDIGNLFAALGSVPIDYFLYVWGNNNPVINIDAIVPLLYDDVAAGDNFSIATRNTDTVWVWGNNSNGQVGDGTRTSRSLPVQLNSNLYPFINAGKQASFAIRNDGMLFAWGTGSVLGLGDAISRSNPTQVGASSWTQVSSAKGPSGAHTLAIKSDGTLYAWGSNLQGQLGNGTTIDENSPIQIGTSSWSQVNANNTRSFAIRTDGALFSWGYGWLGDNYLRRSSPVQIGTSSWTQVNAGGYFAITGFGLAIRIDGGLFSWGYNAQGQLGNGTTVNQSTLGQVGTSSWTTIAAGAYHSAAVRVGGNLFTWGNGVNGALGDNSTISKSSPVQIGSLGWQKISAGVNFTLGKLGSNELYGWGLNSNGQLGINNTSARSSPVQIGGQLLSPASPVTLGSNTSWYAVSANKSTTTDNPYIIALDSNRMLYTWGDNSYGQMGNSSTIYSSSPTQIGSSSWTSVSAGSNFALAIRSDGGLFAWGRNTYGEVPSSAGITTVYSWTSVSSGIFHTAAIRNDGALFTWGLNATGQLGNSTTSDQSSPVQIGTSSWISVSAKGNPSGFTAAIRNDGALFTWGFNGTGQLGLNDTISRSSPTQVGTSSWTSVSAGFSHIAAISSDNYLFTWGAGSSGRLGLGDTAGTINRSNPTQVGNSSWTQVSAGAAHNAALRSDNYLFTWGAGSFGRLGLGDTAGANTFNRSSPTQVGSSSWSQVSSGGTHTAAIRLDGRLFTFGFNTDGQLGYSTGLLMDPRSSPTQVGINSWTSVSAGQDHTVAVSNTGALFVWGKNNYGQLGNNSIVSRSSPVQVGTSSWTTISAGGTHTSAIRNDGSLFTWGASNQGRLGTIYTITNNNTLNRSNPVQVGNNTINVSSPVQVGNSSWKFISSGLSHGMAISNDNTLFTWGSNIKGQLGLNDLISRSSPTQVGTSSWTSIAAGGTHSVAIKSDKKLFTWGYGTNGQLGRNSSLDQIPVQIGTDDWNTVGAGIIHTGAVRSDGYLFMWGAGGSGRLGDNSTISRSSPVQIGTSSWTIISLGLDHSAAIRNDGALFTWGAGSSGKLGNDLTINRSSPVQVGSSSWTGIGAGPGYTVGFTNI